MICLLKVIILQVELRVQPHSRLFQWGFKRTLLPHAKFSLFSLGILPFHKLWNGKNDHQFKTAPSYNRPWELKGLTFNSDSFKQLMLAETQSPCCQWYINRVFISRLARAFRVLLLFLWAQSHVSISEKQSSYSTVEMAIKNHWTRTDRLAAHVSWSWVTTAVENHTGALRKCIKYLETPTIKHLH